jgi:hypothetical protein
MKKISAKEFYKMVLENPSVFEHWDTPLEITKHIDCKIQITHLSKHLLFSGQNYKGNSADFSNCKSLKTATGTFHNYVDFTGSGVEKIEDLHIHKPNIFGKATAFENCKSLQMATGTYPGYVNFSGSGIHSIQNLQIQKPNNNGIYAAFHECPNLQSLEGWDLSNTIVIEPKKLEAEINRRASLKKFIEETKLEELPFL